MKDPDDFTVNENHDESDPRGSDRGGDDDALSGARSRMVRDQIAARGVKDDRLLEAMRNVRRDEFVAREAVEFAYEDTALPIDEGQTISQPYIVAVMAEALEVGPQDRVLDVGTGSGYAAAVLAELAAEVITVERHPSLARSAERRFQRLGIDNVTVRVHDGTLGWEADAPYDAINVGAGGPSVPPELLDQLAPGGRLVIPVGSTEGGAQELLRVRRTPDGFERTDLGAVRFVPLVGESGWKESGEARPGTTQAPDREREPSGAGPGAATEARSGEAGASDLSARVADAAEPFDSIEDAELDALLDRIGDARVVLLGEATHGTSEFYRMRARITRELVEQRGFDLVAVEADWPDAARVDRWVRHEGGAPPADPPFARFPKWMWVNEEVRDFTEWLRGHNETLAEDERVSFHGLDLYSLYGSADAVLDYLDDVDPEAAEVARERYGCLTPWQRDPATYGRAVLSRGYESCEPDVVEMLQDLLENRIEYEREAGRRRYLDAATNARVVANAELYYRIMYYGGRQSWNLRDQHMFDTLADLLDFRGPDSSAVV